MIIAINEHKKWGYIMKIIVLEGSPNKVGSSNLLADNFVRGAQESG